MNVDIDRLAITLDGAPATLGREVGERLAGAIREQLAQQAARGKSAARERSLAQLDLGAIAAPADSSAETISALIAARLVEWLAGEPAAAGGETR